MGTPYWMAPEVISKSPYGTEVRRHAFGLVLVWKMKKKKDVFVPFVPLNYSVKAIQYQENICICKSGNITIFSGITGGAVESYFHR